MDVVNRLSWMFGNEETVRLRRQAVLLREEIKTKIHNILQGWCGCSIICSGSLGEGVAYPPSDDDLMLVNTIEYGLVYDSYEEAINHSAVYMIPSVYSPGFCLLQTTYVTAVELPFLSSKEFREDLIRAMPICYQHGPCASAVIGQFEYDFAKCLLCPRWPTVASEWIIRSRRYGWPSPDLVEKIIRCGCHVVPIGNPDSPLCDLEWRVSFSLAERFLIHEFNHVQFLVYNLLKLVLKVVIGVQVPNVLCSYFLKTVLFYTIENTSQEIWVNNTIDECYRKCLWLLYHFIDTKNCPSYFVPDNNMMRRKVNESNKLPLLRIIKDMMRSSISELAFLDMNGVAFPRFPSYPQIELQMDERFLRGYHLYSLMRDFDFFIQIQCGNDIRVTASNVLSPLLSSCKHYPRCIDSSFLNLLIKRLFTMVGSQCIEASTRITERNTSRYQMLKCGQAMLKIGSNSDVSSGRLRLAYFMFMTGRFRHSLAIIRAVLSDISPYAMRSKANRNCERDTMYMEFMCNSSHSLSYRVRKAWAFDVTYKNDTSAPLPLQIVFALSDTLVLYCDPVAFANYLQGLCFYQIRDFESMNNSVTLLEESVKSFHVDRLLDIFNGKHLLGYMRMLQQDYQTSCRCFTSAYLMTDTLYKMYNDENSRKGQICLIACLLNRIHRIR